MTPGEAAYLILVIVAFSAFGLVLAWTVMKTERK